MTTYKLRTTENINYETGGLLRGMHSAFLRCVPFAPIDMAAIS